MVAKPLLSLEKAMKLSDAHRREQEEERSYRYCNCCGKSNPDGDQDELHVNMAAKLSKKKKTSGEMIAPFLDPESGWF